MASSGDTFRPTPGSPKYTKNSSTSTGTPRNTKVYASSSQRSQRSQRTFRRHRPATSNPVIRPVAAQLSVTSTV